MLFCCVSVLFFMTISCRQKLLFTLVPAAQTGIHFNNAIPETDSVNVLDLGNVYNGAGVGIGDFNNDGLQDIYFTGSLAGNKLYLNKGSFHFLDITDEAGVRATGRWCRGVSVIDINNDGWMDMYVSVSMNGNAALRQNLLYINLGLDQKGVPHFKEMAADYGLNDTTYSTMAAFFDYDNDGDPDVYLAVNDIIDGEYPNHFRPLINDGSFPSTGHLYRNDWNDSLKHPVFTDVSRQAGVSFEGYSHAVVIADINRDGWKDMYVTNDYLSPNILYINNRDGTFTNKSSTYFKHTSANSMGADIEDMNNDGLQDVFELDMNPEDNLRKKMMLNDASYLTYQNSDLFGYQYQYVRNTLQWNQGPRVMANDSTGDPVFSEIAFMSRVAETDWSWTPLLTDFDNDGYRDLVVTNGFPKDITDHDFVAFRNKALFLESKQKLLAQIPIVKIDNYAFHNNGDLTFSDVSKEWGLSTPSFSNGAAYADLDNDGAMDLIVNNINDEAFIYRNNCRDNEKEASHYLEINFKGSRQNVNGLGACVELHYDHGKQQVYENTPYRGYLSSIQPGAHFGLGTHRVVDSVIIKWPDGKMQLLRNVAADQDLQADEKDALETFSFGKEPVSTAALFREITDSVHIHYRHQQRDFIDFDIQRMLPHKLSEYGPGLATGDLDGNGLDDLVTGGAPFHSAQLFLQQANGSFIQKPLNADSLGKKGDDLGLLLFDADGDGDLDLYIASGGYAPERNTADYQDRLYINDGKGNFRPDPAALPANFTSKFCVRAADFDQDGDLDLFVSGRVDPGHYPMPVSSFIYRNDSKNGIVKFTDVSSSVCEDLRNIGMVCDALWTDFDNDGWQDLILAGEWMPLTFLKNVHGHFKNISATTGLAGHTGWWNSLVAGDFDNDGDVDYIAGNLGTNSYYRASGKYPVKLYAGDFDKNGIYDIIPSLYLPDVNGEKEEFPALGRDELLRQIKNMRTKFPTYKSFATASMARVLSARDRDSALIKEANDLQSSFIRNDGNGRFSIFPLPMQAQISTINGMTAGDFDGDGNLDLIMNGNDYGTDVSVGRYDAFNGLFLKGDGRNGFSPESILASGIYIPGNGKGLAQLRGADGRLLVAATQNRGRMKVFVCKRPPKLIAMAASDDYAIITLKNGRSRRQEVYRGSSFLSQSANIITVNDAISRIEINSHKTKRTVFQNEPHP